MPGLISDGFSLAVVAMGRVTAHVGDTEAVLLRLEDDAPDTILIELDLDEG